MPECVRARSAERMASSCCNALTVQVARRTLRPSGETRHSRPDGPGPLRRRPRQEGRNVQGGTMGPRTASLPRRGVLAALTVLAVVAGLLAVGPRQSPAGAAPPGGGRDVIATLFAWPWTSVANECTTVLGPKGYGGVQVSPPQESTSVAGHPWWEVYQPASYKLTSRMGTRAQFASMVATCHAAGIK